MSDPQEIGRRVGPWRPHILLFLALLTVNALTMLLDWQLTGIAPNLLFYLVMPTVSVLGEATAAWTASKIGQRSLTWRDTLTASLAVNAALQLIFQVVLRAIGVFVWQFPPRLHYLSVPLALLALVRAYMRLGNLRWNEALFTALAATLGGLAATALLSLLGLTTAGF